MKEISVVIPTYNRAIAVLEAIHSVLNQTQLPCEIIIVDDCSCDATCEINYEAIHPLLRYIRHEKHLGATIARNTGIEAAKGDWIALLDSDDLWLPNKLLQQINLLEEQDWNQNIFLASNILFQPVILEDRPINKRKPYKNEDLSEFLLIQQGVFHSSTLLIPRAALLKVKFDEKLQKHQDTDIVLRLNEAGIKPIYDHSILAIYRADPTADRITTRVTDVRITVNWLNNRANIISSSARSYYFTRCCLRKALRQNTCYAIYNFLLFGFYDVKAFYFVFVGFWDWVKTIFCKSTLFFFH